MQDDLDGIPLAEADIDGVPLEKEDIDGEPRTYTSVARMLLSESGIPQLRGKSLLIRG